MHSGVSSGGIAVLYLEDLGSSQVWTCLRPKSKRFDRKMTGHLDPKHQKMAVSLLFLAVFG